MTSTDPTNLDRTMANEGGASTINGFKLDTTPGRVQASIDAIRPRKLSGIGRKAITHILPAYSVTSMVLGK